MLNGRQWKETTLRLKERSQSNVPRGQQKATLVEILLLPLSVLGCLNIYLTIIMSIWQHLFPTDHRGNFSQSKPSHSVMQGDTRTSYVPRSWQVCAEVQILSLENDGSARDRLAFDQSAATDISTYARWIIKNTSDPLWRNKLLLLLHPHMQYVSSGGEVEVIFY